MTEPHAVYTAVDPDQLTADQVDKLRRILCVFSLDQLIQLSESVERIGFGVLHITIEKGYGRQIWGDSSEKLERPVRTYVAE